MAAAGEKWLYDQYGNVTEHWGLGTADNTVDARATRDSYDSQNRVSGESLPGNSSPPGAAGSTELRLRRRRQSAHRRPIPTAAGQGYTYDGQGNVLSETQPISGYGSDHTQVASDRLESTMPPIALASQTTPSNSSAGLTTSNAYDLASRQTGADGDANGGRDHDCLQHPRLGAADRRCRRRTDSKTYDTHGNVTSETIGTKTTTSTYNADNQLATQTDADCNLLTNTYRRLRQHHRGQAHQLGWHELKDITTTFDSLCRPTPAD